MTDDFDDVPPEWVERSDDYNVFEERQLDKDRDAGEYDPEPESTQSTAVSVDYLALSLRPTVEHITWELSQLEAYPVASATPEERRALLDLREVLVTLANAVRIRLGAIELAFKRGMEELDARELPVEGYGPVRYAPDEGSWEVHAEELRQDLQGLMKYGLIDESDLERAFKVVVTTTADNRVLNGLTKRGTAVQAAIEKNRTRRQGQPLAGKLTIPKRKEA